MIRDNEVVTKNDFELLRYYSKKAMESANNVLRKTGIPDNKKLINLLNDIQAGNIKDLDFIMEEFTSIMEINKVNIEREKEKEKEEISL